jgi:hypothetical protein
MVGFKISSVLVLFGLALSALPARSQITSSPGQLAVQTDFGWRSSVLSADFIRPMFWGGELSSETIQGVLDRSSGHDWAGGGVGAVVGYAGEKWSDRFYPTVSAGSRLVGDARWRPALFELAFHGNVDAVGEPRDLSGSQARLIAFDFMTFGGVLDLDGERRVQLEVGIARQGRRLEGGFPRAGYFVATDSISAHVFGWSQNFSGRSAFGPVANVHWEVRPAGSPGFASVTIADLGAVRVPSSTVTVIDTAATTTGLSFDELQALLAGETAWTQAVAVGPRWRMLPARVAVQYGHLLSAQWQFQIQVEVGGWMPLPRLEMLAIRSSRGPLGPRWKWGSGLVRDGWSAPGISGWAISQSLSRTIPGGSSLGIRMDGLPGRASREKNGRPPEPRLGYGFALVWSVSLV